MSHEHAAAKLVMRDFERDAHKLADAFADEYREAADLLRNDRAFPNPVWRIAEAVKGRVKERQRHEGERDP